LKFKVQVFRIDELILDSKLYPRMKVGFLTAYQYSQAMKAGAVFPPILVGLYKGKKYVVDGWHRIEAKKLLGEDYIQGIAKKYDSWKEMFVEAVKLNSKHGRPLSVQEKAKIIHRLSEMGFKPEEISEIVHVPVDRIERFKARVIIGPNGQPIYLKSTLVKANVSETEALSVDQDKLVGASVESLMEQLIELLEADVVPMDDDKVKELMVRLYSLLGERLKLAEAV